jgi:hypothetical protein
VFDTNVVVSALIFERRLQWLRRAWITGAVIHIVCRETAAELVRVLTYPKFRLDSDERETLLGDYLTFAEVAVPQLSGIGRSARGVADAQDANHITDDAIPDNVGISGHQFAHVSARDRPATVRKMLKAVASRHYAVCQLTGRPRIELVDISTAR